MYINKYIIACGYSKSSLSQDLSSKLWQCSCNFFFPNSKFNCCCNVFVGMSPVFYATCCCYFFLSSSFVLLEFSIFGFQPKGARTRTPCRHTYPPYMYVHTYIPSIRKARHGDSLSTCCATSSSSVCFFSYRLSCLLFGCSVALAHSSI